MSDGEVRLVGTLGADPELKFTATGKALVSVRIAVGHRWKPRDSDEWQEKTTWIEGTAWDTLAENIAQSLSKGNRVVGFGRLDMDEWPDKETGANRSKITMQIDALGPDLRWATCEVARTERTRA